MSSVTSTSPSTTCPRVGCEDKAIETTGEVVGESVSSSNSSSYVRELPLAVTLFTLLTGCGNAKTVKNACDTAGTSGRRSAC